MDGPAGRHERAGGLLPALGRAAVSGGVGGGGGGGGAAGAGGKSPHTGSAGTQALTCRENCGTAGPPAPAANSAAGSLLLACSLQPLGC